MLHSIKHSARTFFPAIIFFCFILISTSAGFAQDAGILPGETPEQPKDRPTQVTATVIDRLSPSTPILVSPEDDSKLTNNKPTFVWKESTDNFAMDHYTLTLNDSLYFDNIPLIATTNDDYILTYDSLTQQYSLTVKDALDDDDYTWMITAVDTYDNFADSVVWSFGIDTKAPEFVITMIDDLEVEITTEDSDSVPDDPIELSENQPTLSGTGEKNSDVKLTVTLPDGNTQEYEFEIDGDGEWEITLDDLPRDVVVYLEFLITDSYGNVSLLSDVPLKIVTPVIVVPLPIPDTPPGTTRVPSWVPSRVPIARIIDQGEIVIPVIPPGEVITQLIPKRAVFYINAVEATVRETSYMIWNNWLFMSVIALLLFLPLLKLVILLTWWQPYLNWELFRQMLWLIGWWPEKKPGGIVISQKDQEKIGFSLVFFSGKTENGLSYKAQCITNRHGIFPDLKLPPGKYRVSMQHPMYFFPTLEKQPAHLAWNTFYTGSEYTVQNDDPTHLLVLIAEPREYAKNSGPYWLREQILSIPALFVPLAVLAGTMTVFFPSFWNIVALTIYGVLYCQKRFKQNFSNLELSVTTPDKEPLLNVILAFRKKTEPQYRLIYQSQKLLWHKQYLPRGSYQVDVIDLDHDLINELNGASCVINIDKGSNYKSCN